YARAASIYEQILSTTDAPELYFYLASSYENQYRVARKGQPANDQLLVKAEQNYRRAVDELLVAGVALDSTKGKLGKLSLQSLAPLYGTDKLNQPAHGEAMLRRLIQLDPDQPSYRHALWRLHVSTTR